MKKIFLLFLATFSIQLIFGQIDASYKWTWIGGDNGVFNVGIYGQKGVENGTNKPGARAYFYSWMDFQGNFWLFGGQGVAASRPGTLNDLWRYNVSNNRWTWMAGDSVVNRPAFQSGIGVESSNNTPSSRESGSFWTSGDGKELYLFGGFSAHSGYDYYGDVWGFNVVSGKWRILKYGTVDSSGNCTGQAYGSVDQFTPGVWPICRYGATAVTDYGKAYIFGGGLQSSTFQDFYMFSDYNSFQPQNNQWADVASGYGLPIGPVGYYSSSFPYPGARDVANSFIFNNKFYLFGGTGFGAPVNGSSTKGHLNDLWRYDGRHPLTGKTIWKWVSGDSTINNAGSYGNLGIGNPSNKPKGRGHAMMKSAGGAQLILFGGYAPGGDLNDLWSYDAQSNIWTWLNGSPITNDAGNYGIKGLQLKTNMITARSGTGMWVTSNGEIYVFGGSTPWGKKNDMWKLSPQDEPDPPNDEPCNAISLVLDAPALYGSNKYATSTNDLFVPCYQSTNTVWYKYTPSVSGSVRFTLGAGLSGDTLNSWLSVFVSSLNNCPSSISLIDSTSTVFGGCRYYYSPSKNNPTSWSSFLSAGKTYYFRISGMFGDIGRYGISIESTKITSIATGNWNDPAIWSNNKVPTSESEVTIFFPVSIDGNAICKSLSAPSGSQVTVQSGFTLTILNRASTNPFSQDAAALNFDGVNDYIIIPHNNLLKPSTGITIEAWIKPVDIHTNVYSEVYRKEDGNARHLLSFQNNGTILSFGLGVAGVYSELDVPIIRSDYEGQWVHIAATFDGNTKKLYRNDKLIGSQNVSGLISTSGTAAAFIGSLAGGAEFFNGNIDEFRLWDHAIQVETKLSCEFPVPVNGLLLYYKFNQGIANGTNTALNIVSDFSGNNINGSLVNFSLSGTYSNWVTPGGIQTGFFCPPPY